MKRLNIFLIVAAMAVCFAGVSKEIVKVPAITYESKTICALDAADNSNGAIDFTFELSHAGAFTPDMRLPKIHWERDEWFYTCGYKMKLSNAVDEIIAPPDMQEEDWS